jgi:nitrate reductase assembly molybdenum cofactor insertion protein NarJ
MNAPMLIQNSEVRRLIEEAAEWRLLSLLFQCPRAGWHDEVAGLSRNIADKDLAGAAHYALGQASEGLYHSLFGPGGPAPAREVSYRDAVQLGYVLSELEANYAAFHFQPRTSEPPDHVSVEADFVGYLRLKEAYALACEDPERAEVTALAARNFLAEHLAVLAHPLAHSLNASGIPFLSEAGKALVRRVGEAPKPAAGQADLLPVLAEESFGCGSLS